MELISELQTCKTFFLISAILNLLVSVSWIISGPAIVVGTCGIGCLFFFIPVISIIAAVMDFNAYNKLNSLNRTGTFQTMQTAAVLEIATVVCFNMISLTFGIIILTYISKDNVKAFLTEKGIY